MGSGGTMSGERLKSEIPSMGLLGRNIGLRTSASCQAHGRLSPGSGYLLYRRGSTEQGSGELEAT